MRIFIRSLFFTLIYAPFSVLGQNDTLSNYSKPSVTSYFTQNQFEYLDSINKINISLKNFHKYIPKNNLGNTGLVFNDLSYSPLPSTIGFNYYKNNYQNYFFSNQKILFYNTRTPYTDVFYVIGTKREQLFKMIFSYNIKKNWNISVDFLRIRSEGVYLRQNTNDNSIDLTTNYKSDNNKYWLIGSIALNSYKNAENGGIQSDSVFENGGSIDKKLLDIKLTSAKKSVGNFNFFLKQILNFGKNSKDTSKAGIIPYSRLILTSGLDANYFKYEDSNPMSGFYSNVFYDTIKTFDSSFYYNIENEIAWKRLDNLKHRGLQDIIGLGLNVKHQFISVRQRSIDSTFNNIIIGAELYNTYSNHSFFWNLTGKYVVNGYNIGDHLLSGCVKKQISNYVIGIYARTQLQEADFIYNKYRSNHFLWDNDFKKTTKNSAEAFFQSNKYDFKINATFSKFTNIAYFDNYAVARMYNGSLSVLSVALNKDFSFFNWHLDNKIVYQIAPDSCIIRIPEYILEHSLYYENNLLKDALLVQIGASLFFTSSFYANSYMPATGQFYLQNDKKTGNYPFIDFFINAQVKNVRIFFKIDHLNSGWSGNNYMVTPDYPYPDRTFKLGVSWKFFD
jgi:hypothetical protein